VAAGPLLPYGKNPRHSRRERGEEKGRKASVPSDRALLRPFPEEGRNKKVIYSSRKERERERKGTQLAEMIFEAPSDARKRERERFSEAIAGKKKGGGGKGGVG